MLKALSKNSLTIARPSSLKTKTSYSGKFHTFQHHNSVNYQLKPKITLKA